jgi:signal transduction histidine kinase/CheY-like chemotaxis protein
MWSFLERLLDSSTFSPHGICLLWEPELIWLHVISDAVIAASYFSIPFALAIVVSKRRDFQFGWMAWLFAAFILLCGLTHVFAIYTLWVPIYGLEGLLKAMTAIASVFTAVLLWPLIPKILAIPTERQLREAHVALAEEGRHRQRQEFLLQRFREAEANESKIRQAQKMEAVGQLTGGIAHDFNNILTVITGTIEILADAVADKPSLAAIAKMIDEAAGRGADLTQRLLAFARRQPLQPREVDINDLVVDTVKLLKPTLGEHIEVEALLKDGLPPALVDPSQLTTALLNLSLNSRDAMPRGGRLLIETGRAILDEAYAKENREVQPGQYVMLAVSDTGAGIAKDIQEKVFEPFFTTKAVGRGTGLGLSMVYGFVKQTGGHIKIYSEEGQGTTIKLYLPPSLGKAEARDTSVAPDIQGGSEAILVVEDDELVRTYVVTQLLSLGYDVTTAANAAEALEVIKTGKDIDVLFTDVIMPGMNGRQLADAVKLLRPSIGILYTSGYSENAIVHHGRLDPGVLLLAKPYRKADLARMIRKAVPERT